MKIWQISVAGLFGIFDHVIPLNVDERITIVHGPNGFGKTAMLRMLDGFFNSQYSVFWDIPFNSFRIDFDDDSSVEILKSNVILESDRTELVCNFSVPHLEKRSYSIKEHERTSFTRVRQTVFDLLVKIGESQSGDSEALQHTDSKSQEEPEWLRNLKNSINIRLIESQRLLNSESSRLSGDKNESSPMLPTVSAYSRELAQLIQPKLAEYGATAQSLDRTFPARVVRQHSSSDMTDEQLRHQLNELEATRTRLVATGLLDKDENSDFQIQPQVIDKSTKSVLSVYVEDAEKKLNVFNDIARKIDLLGKIVNQKFAYSYKEMHFSKEKGFVFKTLYHSPFRAETLSPTDLSSGEQHELVLLYELLFKVQPNSLVLIDEPELSLHVGWQAQFLKDLQEITKLADLDILMATHSPDIIQDRWDLTVELQGLAQ
jgi:predicted ATP-binding protein involved in virulence